MRKEEREFRRQNSECRITKGDCHTFDCSLDAARDMAQGRPPRNDGGEGESDFRLQVSDCILREGRGLSEVIGTVAAVGTVAGAKSSVKKM